jgi:hypothetical protein
MYLGALVLAPPITAVSARARLATTSTPRRLHRSARIPEDTSTIGTKAAYAAAITPTAVTSKPISFMNRFSTGTQLDL